LLKDSPSNLITHAIHEVAKGNTFHSPAISRRMRTIYDEIPIPIPLGNDIKKDIIKLTNREIEVLQLIAEGDANKQVAGELNISIKTVEKHRQNLPPEKLIPHQLPHPTTPQLRLILSRLMLRDGLTMEYNKV
jgi:DNA-binding NarL/FixJ family response regulator